MNRLFGDREFLKKLAAIALPLGLQSAINMVVHLIDSVMIGSLGDTALSAVNIGGQFPYLYMTCFMGLGTAASVIASQAWGNKRPDKVKDMMSLILKICIPLNIVFFLLAFLLPSQIISIYTNSENIIENGAVFLKILSFSCLIQSFSQSVVYLLRPCGVNNLGFISTTFACLCNIFFNWIFIFGNLGVPAMGIAGAAIGTVLARIAEFLVVFGYMLKDEKLGFRMEDLNRMPEKEMLADFRKLAIPSTISEVTGNLNVSAAAMITGRVSEYYIAANSIVHNMWTISSLFMFGIAMGAGVMIGHEIGANRQDKTEEYAKYFINIAVVVGVFGAVMTLVLAPFITSLFNVSEGTIATVNQLKYAASIAVFFNAMQIIMNKGILRGAGQAAAVTKVDLTSCWLVNIPVGFLVALVLHMPPFFIYLSLRCDYLIKTIWAFWKLGRGNWIIRMNVD